MQELAESFTKKIIMNFKNSKDMTEFLSCTGDSPFETWSTYCHFNTMQRKDEKLSLDLESYPFDLIESPKCRRDAGRITHNHL